MRFKVTRSQCELEEYAKDNYYARLDSGSYHYSRERHFATQICQDH